MQRDTTTPTIEIPSRSELPTIEIPSRSESTEWDPRSHDYSTLAASNNSYRSRSNNSSSAVITISSHNPQQRSLMDDSSPTSIYTTETDLPFDEKMDEEVCKKGGKPLQNSGNLLHNRHRIDPSVTRRPIFPLWTSFGNKVLRGFITKGTVLVAKSAARNPYTYLLTMTVASLAVLLAGFFANFTLIVDTETIFTPLNSLPVQHYDWILHESGFNAIRPLLMVLHANGNNVLGKQPVEKLFEAVDKVRETDGYEELCHMGTYVDFNNDNTCRILSATRFWNHDHELFEKEIVTDDDVIEAMSQEIFRPHDSGQTPVFHEMILGNYEMSNSTLQYNASTNSMIRTTHSTPRLHFVQSYVVRIELPDVPEADEFETRLLDRLADLKQQWEEEAAATTTVAPAATAAEYAMNATDIINDSNYSNKSYPLVLDFLSIFAYTIENQRAIVRDLPLLTGIFLVLVIFTTLVFTKKHKVYSRSMLGVASLLTIGMSLCLSYGIVWLLGIPFTNIVQILPFMIMGVGLDDTFIITGTYCMCIVDSCCLSCCMTHGGSYDCSFCPLLYIHRRIFQNQSGYGRCRSD
jgi:hypothetical protein